MNRTGTRAAWALAVGAAALLAGCGSGHTVSDLHPDRFVTVGDAFMDVGQVGALNPDGKLYTVNDGTPLWVQQIAGRYHLTLTPASAGGGGYAEGGACVATTDACDTAARTVTAQVDALLAAQPAVHQDDLVFVSGGIQDIVAAVAAYGADSTQASDAVSAAGRALGAQVGRIWKAGAGHILVTGVANLGNTPWAQNAGVGDAVQNLSNTFNDGLLGSIPQNTAAHVLFSGVALLSNLAYNNDRKGFDFYRDFEQKNTPACGETPILECTPQNTLDPANYNRYIFASDLYFTPAMLNLYSDDDYSESVYWRMKDNW